MSVDTLLNQIPFQNRKRVKDDIGRVMLNCKTLMPKIGALVSNTGVESKVIVLGGTVPIFYQNVQYNIPVEIFVTQKYPAEAPKIYVRPTPNMTIKQNHRHVDLQGLVFLPYLHEWNAESNLSGLVEITSSVFSIEPPLFSKPAVAAPSPILQAYANSSSSNASPVTVASSNPAVLTSYAQTQRPSVTAGTPNYTTSTNITYASSANLYPTTTSSSSSAGASHNPAMGVAALTPYSSTPAIATPYSGSSSSGAAPATATAVYAPSPTIATVATASPAASTASSVTTYSASSFGITATSTAQATAAAAAEAQKAKDKRAKMIAEITRRMRDQLHTTQEILRVDMDNEFSTEKYLEQSNDKAQGNLRDLQSAIEQYEAALKLIAEKEVALSEWEAAEKEKPVPDVEQRLEPYDDLAAQIVKLNGELNAIDDAFYYLDRALEQGSNKSVDLNSYLKEIRRLAKQQFMCKATLMKINATYQQQQSMAQQMQQAQVRQTNAVPYPVSVSGTIGGVQGYPVQQSYTPLQPYSQQPSPHQWPQVPTTAVAPPPAAAPAHKGGNRAKLTIL